MTDFIEHSGYVNHSGGAAGADMAWETVGLQYKVHTVSYSFPKHNQYGQNPYLLSERELNEGYQHVLDASTALHRPVYRLSHYVRNLLSRNWFQVKYAEAVFAIGELQSTCIVNGGTGWAVQMAINVKKPVYVFDQSQYKCWLTFDYTKNLFVECTTPILTKQFAGIGTRNINDDGLLAIGEVYEVTFNPTIQ